MSQKTFSGITEAVWSCVQTTSEKEHGTTYTPAPPSYQGSSSTPAVGSTVDLNFNVDLTAGTVTYEITHKPFIVTDSEIWNGIQQSIDACSNQGGSD